MAIKLQKIAQMVTKNGARKIVSKNESKNGLTHARTRNDWLAGFSNPFSGRLFLQAFKFNTHAHRRLWPGEHGCVDDVSARRGAAVLGVSSFELVEQQPPPAAKQRQ